MWWISVEIRQSPSNSSARSVQVPDSSSLGLRQTPKWSLLHRNHSPCAWTDRIQCCEIDMVACRFLLLDTIE